MRRGWGTMAIIMGAWEAAAFSHDRVPTITATIRACHRRRRKITKIAVGIWLIALGAHLLDDEMGHDEYQY